MGAPDFRRHSQGSFDRLKDPIPFFTSYPRPLRRSFRAVEWDGYVLMKSGGFAGNRLPVPSELTRLTRRRERDGFTKNVGTGMPAAPLIEDARWNILR